MKLKDPETGKVTNEKVLKVKMQRVQGPSLFDFLQDGKLLTVENAMNVSCKIIEFFSILHFRYGISHGDIKNDNIIIDEETMNPFFIDWGCSRWGSYTHNCKRPMGNLVNSGPELLRCNKEANEGTKFHERVGKFILWFANQNLNTKCHIS